MLQITVMCTYFIICRESMCTVVQYAEVSMAMPVKNTI